MLPVGQNKSKQRKYIVMAIDSKLSRFSEDVAKVFRTEKCHVDGLLARHNYVTSILRSELFGPQQSSTSGMEWHNLAI
jgi:hypothetical protein